MSFTAERPAKAPHTPRCPEIGLDENQQTHRVIEGREGVPPLRRGGDSGPYLLASERLLAFSQENGSVVCSPKRQLSVQIERSNHVSPGKANERRSAQELSAFPPRSARFVVTVFAPFFSIPSFSRSVPCPSCRREKIYCTLYLGCQSGWIGPTFPRA